MKTTCLLLLLSLSLTLAQTSQLEPVNQAFLPQGIRWQGLGSNGFSYNFTSSLSQISGSNPATLTALGTLAFGLSYQYDTDIEEAFIFNFGHKKSYVGLPQSIAFVYSPDEKLTLGFSAAQKYNSILDLGKIIIRTVQNPDGTGETYSVKHQTNIYSFSGILAYDLSQIFSGINLGFRYNHDNFWISQKIFGLKAEGTGSSSSFAFGLSYKTETGFGQIELASYYEQGVAINGTLEITGPDLLTIDPDYEPERFKTIVLLPNRWHLGANFNSGFGNFLIDLALIEWKSTGELKNTLEYSASYGRQFSEELYLSFGVFSTDRKLKEASYPGINNLSALFLTMGAKTTFMGMDIDLAIADSHLFSDSWREQTIFKIAVDKSF